MSAEASASPYIHRIGQLARARGLDGEVQGRLFRPRPDAPVGRLRHLQPPALIELEWRDGRRAQLEVSSIKFADPTRISLRFTGVDDRSAAEVLEGAFIDVDPRRAPEFLCDALDALFDAEVVDADSGVVLGRIDDLRDTGAHPLLVVGELMIPFVEAFIVERATDRLSVRLPEGLLEVNQP